MPIRTPIVPSLPTIIVRGEKLIAMQVPCKRDPAVQELLVKGDGGVVLGEIVPARPDVLGELDTGGRGEAGDELDGRAAVPDHGYAFVLEVYFVLGCNTSPVEVVEGDTFELVQARDLGDERGREGTVGGDQDVGGVGGSVRWAAGMSSRSEGQGVRLRCGVPGGRDVFRVEDEAVQEVCIVQGRMGSRCQQLVEARQI